MTERRLFFTTEGAEPLETLVKRSPKPVFYSGLFTTQRLRCRRNPGPPKRSAHLRRSSAGQLLAERQARFRIDRQADRGGEDVPVLQRDLRRNIHQHGQRRGVRLQGYPQGTVFLPFVRQGRISGRGLRSGGQGGAVPRIQTARRRTAMGILLKAKEACRVAGEIRDENGNVPTNTETMSVWAWFKDDGEKYSLAHGFVKADGSYLIDGLSDKPVYVMVVNWRNEEQGEGYPAVYAPGTFFRGEAKLVTFDKSRNVEGVNITLRKTGGLVLEGTMRDEKGEPIPEAFVVVHHRDMLFDRVTTYTDAQGHYELQALGDGEVLVHVDAMHRGFVQTPLRLLSIRRHRKCGATSSCIAAP